MKQIMNKKTFSLLLVLVFLLAPVSSSYGFLTRDDRQSTSNRRSKIESRSSSSASGWLRATVTPDPTDDFDTGAGTDNNETTANDAKAPIGNGIWILLPLALGYGVLRFHPNRIKN